MVKLFTAISIVFTSLTGQAQTAVSPTSWQSLSMVSGKTLNETAVSIGKQFLGRPYVAHTLDVNPTEQLVVSLSEFDCTTYLETVLALSLAWQDPANRSNPTLFDQTFRKYLTKLRYRDGQINGYASRLHYFSDWLRDNVRKGLVVDITNQLPGTLSVAKPVSYMTSATYRYPPLTDPTVYKLVAQTEASLSQLSFSFIPKRNVRLAEAQIHEGDIIMLAAARPGLDMKHVGLAVRQADGQLHLLHASSEFGAVVITPCSLSDYVLKHKHLSGLRVARLGVSSSSLTAIADK